MRLKLNRTLRAALIAAISTVGFTLTQAQGKSWDGGANIDTNWFYTNNGGVDRTLVDTEDGTINLTAEGNGAAGVTASIATITAKDGGTLRIVGGNVWGATDRFFKDLTIDTLKAGEAGTGEVFINTQQFNGNCGPDRATAALKHVQGTLTGVDNYAFLTLGTEGGTISASGTLENLRDDATLTLNGAYTFDTTIAAGYTVKQEGTVVWSDTENSQGFKKTSGSTFYAIKGATKGAGFSVSSSTGPTVSEDEDGNYYFTAGDVTDTSKFYVKAATATLENVDATGQIIVEHNGATVTVKNATFRDTSGSKDLNIIVDDQGVLEVTHSGSNGYVTGDITIKGGGTFRVAGQHDAFGWGGGTTKNIILQGEVGKIATLDLQQTTGNSVTMNAALKLMGYAAVTGAKGFNTHDGSFYAEGVQNTIESFQIRHDATFEVKEGGELTVGTMTKGNDGNKVLTKTGKGTMTFTAKAQAEGLVINEGSIVITGGTENSFNALSIAADGALTVTGGTTTVSGTSNVLSNTISVTGGTLTLNGTYEIGGNTGEMTTTYEGGEVDGNGFAHIAGSSKVYTTAESATVNVDNAHFTVGGAEVAVEDGVYTTEGSTNYGTFYVKNGTESLAKAIAYAEGHTVNSVSLAEGTTINADKADASIGLVMESGASATLNATEATTISSISGWTKTLTVTGNGAVTMPGGTMTLAGVQKLDVQGTVTVNTNKILLDSDTAVLNVAEGATLNITGNNNLTPNKGTVNISGTVNVGHELDLSNGSKATGIVNVGSTGKLSAWGMWMHSGVAVHLDEGGEFSIGQNEVKDLTIIGKVGGGSISYTNAAKDANYGTNNADYKITNATVTTTGASVTLGNTLSGVDVFVADGSSLTLNTNADSVTVGNGGTFTLNEGKTVTNITVQDGGTIAGGVDAKGVKIAAAGTATFDEGISAEGVQLGWSESAAVTNMKGEAAAYGGIHDTSMQVSTDVLVAESDTDVSVDNHLVVSEIVNYGIGTLTITNIDTEVPTNVVASMGDVTLQNVGADPIELPNLSLYGATVAAYTAGVETSDQEATVTVTEVLEVAGDGTLLANLVMADDSALLVGGVEKALHVGSTLTMNTGIQLDEATLRELDGMGIGDTFWLIDAAEGRELVYMGESGDDAWYDAVFSRIAYGDHSDYTLQGDFNIAFSETDGFGLKKFSNTPEPTTGTLSLLALAALAARRRRK